MNKLQKEKQRHREALLYVLEYNITLNIDS